MLVKLMLNNLTIAQMAQKITVESFADGVRLNPKFLKKKCNLHFSQIIK
jgi:hypothetical protein